MIGFLVGVTFCFLLSYAYESGRKAGQEEGKKESLEENRQ